MDYDRIVAASDETMEKGWGRKVGIPTSAVTSLQYRRVMEATLRRGEEYLSLLPVETWLEPAKGFSRLPTTPMIRTSSNPIANVLRTPAQVPYSNSLLGAP